MRPRLPVVTSREVIKVAKKVGFVFDRQSGSHAVYIHEQKKLRIVIPIHKGERHKTEDIEGDY